MAMEMSGRFKYIIEEKEVSYYVWWTICRDFTTSKILKRYLGKPYKNQLYYFKNNDAKWATDLDAWNELGRKLVNNIFDNNFNIGELVKEHYYYGNKLDILYEKIEKSDFSQSTPRQIAEWFEYMIDNYLKLNELGFVAVISDAEHNYLSKGLKKILLKKNKINQNNIQIYLNKLIVSERKNIFWQEEADWLNLLIKYSDLDELKHAEEFLNHVKKYNWINYGYMGPTWTVNEFISRAKDDLDNITNLVEQLNAHYTNLKEIEKLRIEAENELNLSKDEKYYFQIAREFSFVKSYRVGYRYRFCYLSRLLFSELAKRNHVPLNIYYYSDHDELINLIYGKKVDMKEISARNKFYCELRQADDLQVLTKKDLNLIIEKYFIKESIEYRDVLSGQVAFLGKIKGKAKIVLGPQDVAKVEEGDVLVAVYTDPNLLPAMKRAGAFVTEQGGITSHAAIVAREMKKPCIIGTKTATKVFKDGDMLEVDATKGIIKKI